MICENMLLQIPLRWQISRQQRAPVVMASTYIARVDVATVDCADSAKFVVLVVFTDAVV